MTTVIIVALIVLLLLAALRLQLTAIRLDRLHVRTEAAWAALEGALARRIVAARALAATGGLDPVRAAHLRRLAAAADTADRAHRADAESGLARALADLPPGARSALNEELLDAAERVRLAGSFYNDAVRDTLALRASWFTRFFRLAGHARLPEYFEITEMPGTTQMPGTADVPGRAEIPGPTEIVGSTEIMGNTDIPVRTEILGITETGGFTGRADLTADGATRSLPPARTAPGVDGAIPPVHRGVGLPTNDR